MSLRLSGSSADSFSFLGFIACVVGGMACFGIAFLFLPIRQYIIHLPSTSTSTSRLIVLTRQWH